MFEDIFARYSKLAITIPSDRPVAISGLESKLATFYHTKSIRGILLKFLYRSLLWKRFPDTIMQSIIFPEGVVPSWYWMAKSGGIEYGNQGWHKIIGTELNDDLELNLEI